jgi:hypothetical protein
MSKAKYSTDNIGHGLAFDYYSHFTSPMSLSWRYGTPLFATLSDGGKSADEETMKLNVYILLQWKD